LKWTGREGIGWKGLYQMEMVGMRGIRRGWKDLPQIEMEREGRGEDMEGSASD